MLYTHKVAGSSPAGNIVFFLVITICLADEIKDIRGHTGVLFSFFCFISYDDLKDRL